MTAEARAKTLVVDGDGLRERIEPLPQESRDRILGQNAVDAYGLPL
jgi:hypothetical protein